MENVLNLSYNINKNFVYCDFSEVLFVDEVIMINKELFDLITKKQWWYFIKNMHTRLHLINLNKITRLPDVVFELEPNGFGRGLINAFEMFKKMMIDNGDNPNKRIVLVGADGTVDVIDIKSKELIIRENE